MTPIIGSVTAISATRLLIVYANGERRYFDLGPWLGLGRFSELADESLFRAVRVAFDAIEWPNGLDIDPEELYAISVPLEGDAAEGSPRYEA
jgi:hypothetical protein